jgi:hypothetical protein
MAPSYQIPDNKENKYALAELLVPSPSVELG